MSFLMIMAATAISAPLPIKAKPAQYPTEFLAAEKSAAAVLELVISPEGKIVQCRMLETHGDEQFAQRLCRLQNPRSWAAATDEHNAPAFGVVRNLSRMFVPETPEGDKIAKLAPLPDLELSVSALPASVQSRLDAKVSLWVDATGSVTQCEPRPEQIVPSVYLKLACEQARSLIRLGGVLLEGKPIPGFAIEQTIRFVAQAKE